MYDLNATRELGCSVFMISKSLICWNWDWKLWV